jgi:hypothetical protein
MPLESEIGNLCRHSIGWMPDNRKLLSLDANLTIPTRVLCFEVLGLRRRTPVRPGPTGQTGPMLLLALERGRIGAPQNMNP